MVYYDLIDVFEGIYINEASLVKECIIFPYCYFLDKGFRFQPTVCNSCYDVFMIPIYH